MTNYSPVIRPATRDDIERFKGDRDLGPSVKALVGEVDGNLIALGGLAYSAGKVVAFLDLKPEARKYKKSMHRAALQVMQMARAGGHRYVYASADPEEPSAERWLARLGFDQVGDGKFRWAAHG
jgi:hypothetical protein